jgi:uncharacterized delta-60 repeat protein
MLRTSIGRVSAAIALVFATAAVALAQTTVDGFDPGANSSVRAIAVQSDGKILIGGSFTKVGGGGFGNTTRNHIARLNADGSVDASFNPGANNDIIAMAVQTDGKVVVGGLFTTIGGGGTGSTTRNRIARLNADGSVDASFNPGANAAVESLVLQSDGKIVVGGSFTTLGGGGTGSTPRSSIGRVNADGSVDATFNPGADCDVQALAVQSDGGILVGGCFFHLGGNATVSRTFFGRVNPDGSIDTVFDPHPDSAVYAIVIQSDGRAVVGGAFAGFGGFATGVTRRSLARLSTAGVVDAQFNPGSDGNVYAIALQPDGRFVIGGSFSRVGGGGTGSTPRQDLARINADGSVDATFDPGANSIVGIQRVVVQPDGKILVSGDFTQLGGGGSGTTARNGIGRINSGVAPAGPAPTITSVSPAGGWGGGGTAITITGTNFVGGALVSVGGVSATSVVVTSATTITAVTPAHAGGTVDVVVANPDLQTATKVGGFIYARTTDVDSFDPGASFKVTALALQSDGKLLVAGGFSTLGGGGTGTATRGNIGRVNSDGSIDAGFAPGADGEVDVLLVQPDGRILAGGYFTKLGGGGTGNNGVTARSRIGRLNADGTVDSAFNPGANAAVHAMALQADGKIVVGGAFTTLGGVSRSRIGRLNADGSIDSSFNPGSSAEVWSLAIQPDGRILVGSGFSFASPSSAIRRLNSDGSTDSSFVPPVPSSTVGPFAVLADGRLLVGGYFSNADGSVVRNGVVRLSASGALDATFNAGTDGYFDAILPRSDGRTVVGGLFLTIGPTGNTTPRHNIALLSADGSLDQSFDAGANGEVYALVPQPDGKIIAGGSFTKLGGGGNGVTVRNNLARFTLPVALPTMTLDKTSLAFGATVAKVFPSFGFTTGPQQVRLTQTGSGSVTWTATSNQPYVVVSPTSGTGSATLTVSIVSGSLDFIPVAPQITFTFSGAANNPGPIRVGVQTHVGVGTTAAPTGSFDTPTDGATGVAGSIAVTGWAMDDVQVSRIRIYRDPVAGEGSAQVYIGDGVFVDGARPDVQALFPNFPLNTRAGWGYLMLTNFLPNLGNGTFKLYAYADDVEGHTTLLGTKTITCANNSATAPFGALDTPAQGEVISGTAYNNFGWVMSPGTRRADVPGGGTVQVLIDGINVGTPGGWVARADLTSLFPLAQFSGVSNAAAALTFDTTTLTNGVHTIAWIVTANSGGSSGVGSRFFTVSNGAMLKAEPAVAGLRAEAVRPGIITGRRGFDLNAPFQTYDTGPDGRVTIEAEEIDRIELRLEEIEGIEGSARRLEGALRVGGRLGPLPVGSTLDAASGTFVWMPGPGFLGSYDFVFGGRDVRVVLNPKGSNRVGPQVVIDVADGRILAGWAADLDSQVDSGVATVHVWAYPVDGGGPIFLGAADYGGARPDVAAIYGERFGHTGYGLRVDGLAPGTYDLAVFAYSTVKGGFVPARTVRVTVR